MNRIITARFEAGKRGIIAGAGCTGDNGPWVVPGDRCHHVLTPKEGVEYSVEIVGQTKQGNLRFGRIVSTAALVRSVEREAAQLIRAQGVGTETTAFRRGTIRIVATSRRDYDHVDVTLHVEIVEFPGCYIEVAVRNVPIIGEAALEAEKEARRIAWETECRQREEDDRHAKEEFWALLPEWAREFVYEPETAHRHFERKMEFPASVEWCGGESHRLYSESRWCKYLVVLFQEGTRVYRKAANDDILFVERTEEPDDEDEDNDGGQFCSGQVSLRFRDPSRIRGLFWVSVDETSSYSDSDTSHCHYLWVPNHPRPTS